MRRYGFTFIKGSGADYKFSALIEAWFFGGVVALPLLAIINPSYASDILISFFFFMFVLGVLAILGEMLPKVALYISLLLITILYIFAVQGAINYSMHHKVENVLFYNVGVQTLFYLLLGFVNITIINNLKSPKVIEE